MAICSKAFSKRRVKNVEKNGEALLAITETDFYRQTTFRSFFIF